MSLPTARQQSPCVKVTLWDSTGAADSVTLQDENGPVAVSVTTSTDKIGGARLVFGTHTSSVRQLVGPFDYVRVYIDSAAPVTTCVTGANVMDIQEVVDFMKNETLLTCADKTRLMLDKPLSFRSDSVQVDSIIQNNVIARLNLGEAHINDTTYVASAKVDGASFPDHRLYGYAKRAYEYMNELCTDAYTEDGQYNFWIQAHSGKPCLHFSKRAQAANAAQPVLVEGRDFNKINMKFTSYNNPNSILLFCGVDSNDANIWWQFTDGAMVSKMSGRIIQDFMDCSEAGERALKEKVASGLTNEEARELARSYAETEASKYVNRMAGQHWKGEVKLKGNHVYNVNETVQIKAQYVGHDGDNWSSGHALEIKEIVHDVDKTGWITTLVLEEPTVEWKGS